MTDGTAEARTAAQWWAEQLNPDSPQRNGDAMNEAFAALAQSKQTPPTPEQLAAFRDALECAILAMLRDPSNAWEKAIEQGREWGSSLRTIGVDYGPDPILGDAIKAAGLPKGAERLLPMKTTMWIDPGRVAVGLGYNAPPEELALVKGSR